MLVSGRVVDLKRNSLGGFAPWVSEDDEPWVPRFPQKSGWHKGLEMRLEAFWNRTFF